jgi:hypothetical protein
MSIQDVAELFLSLGDPQRSFIGKSSLAHIDRRRLREPSTLLSIALRGLSCIQRTERGHFDGLSVAYSIQQRK